MPRGSKLTGVEVAARICTDHVVRIREDFAAANEAIGEGDRPARLPRVDLEDVLLAAEYLHKVERANVMDTLKMLELTGDRESAIAMLRERRDAMTGTDESVE